MLKDRRVILLVSVIIITFKIIAGCSSSDLPQEYTLTVNGAEGGIIELDPNQDEYEEGTEVKIKAVSDDNWEFVKWQGSLEGEKDEPEIRIVVDRDLLIEGEFVRDEEKEEKEDEEDEEDEEKEIEGHVSLTNRTDTEDDNGTGRPFVATNSTISTNGKAVEVEPNYYGEDEIIVKFKNNANKEEVLSEFQLNRKGSSAFGTEILGDVGNRDIKNLINKLNKNPNIEYAELNRIYNALIEPTEPQNADSYGEQEEYYSLISLPYAWSITNGSNDVSVAVFDTGVNSDHPDLKDNIIAGKNFTEDGSSDDTSDINGHGTHVAGIIGAADNVEVVGVSWEVALIPVKVLGDDGSGTLSGIVEGIEWVIKEGETDIINMSLGVSSDSQTLKEAVEKAHDAGITVIAAAGNSGEEDNYKVNYPAAYEKVIAVGSVDNNKKRSSFSSYGENLHFMAPGEGIYSTTSDGEYGPKWGTSMAAPHVAGVAALLLSKNPTLRPDEIREKLKLTAQDLGEIGKNYEYGYGLINSHAAVKIADSQPEIKIFAGEKDEEERKIHLKSDIISPNAEGFYNLEGLDGEYYIYAWLDLSNTNEISRGDYFGKFHEKIEEGSNVNFELNLITSNDEFQVIVIE